MLGLGARCTGGCTPPLPRGAADGGLSGWATTPCWRSTHGFPHSSKCSGRIRPGPMREKTEYRDELLEHAFMGCLRAGLRSLPEGQELGGEEEKKAVCEVCNVLVFHNCPPHHWIIAKVVDLEMTGSTETVPLDRLDESKVYLVTFLVTPIGQSADGARGGRCRRCSRQTKVAALEAGDEQIWWRRMRRTTRRQADLAAIAEADGTTRRSGGSTGWRNGSDDRGGQRHGN